MNSDSVIREVDRLSVLWLRNVLFKIEMLRRLALAASAMLPVSNLCCKPFFLSINRCNRVRVATIHRSALTYTSGTPKPLVMWFTPSGEEISLGALLNDDALRIRYSLSAYGEVLTVRDVRLDKTGLYR